MFGHNFRHDTIKKYIAVFGSMFNDIQIERYDNDTSLWNQIKIPLSYGPRDALIAKANRDFEEQVVALISPRISFTLSRYYRDPSRQTNPRTVVRLGSEKHMYNAVPYNFEFEVNVIAKSQTDGNRIIEQILPFFAPSMTISMYPISGDTSYSKDLKVSLNSITAEDQYEGDFSQRRSTMWSLQFVLQGFLFGPVTEDSVIKKVEVNLRANNDVVRESIFITPGVDEDGHGTTDPNLAIPYQDVNSTDDWEFITQYETGIDTE